MTYQHIPVLLEEVLTFLDPEPNQNYVDATLGGGGYSSSLLGMNKDHGKVLSIDLDQVALDNFLGKLSDQDKKRAVLAHGNFAQIDHLVNTHNFDQIDGIVADIGLSSYQLDSSGRGISFQVDEPLDMRFDLSSDQPDAKFIVNFFETARLNKIFHDFSEDKFSQRIVNKIAEYRSEKQIETTFELVEIIKSALPKPVAHRWKDSARRIFQALRIEVNHELENLQTFLPKAFDLLKPGGRLVVVTFHSLEDRIVKQYFSSLSKGCVCPVEFPICKCGRLPLAKILTKKPITPGVTELEQNSRSKSAKLRAIYKN